MIPFANQTADGVRVVGAVFPAADSARGLVVLAHGLPAGKPPADAAATDEGYPGLAQQIAATGLNVAIFNFRGTGESGGHLDIDLWPLDLAATLDWLDGSEFHRQRYGVVGFSAGGAATITRSRDDARIDPLIAMAAPADYSFLPVNAEADRWFQLYRELGMIRGGYPGDAASWAARFARVRPGEAIAAAQARTIALVHGALDDVVPVAHAERLAQSAGPRATLTILPGVMHQMRREPKAVAALMDILRTAM
jgi:alpha-beta hydrolase superfamily lysophospholipase